MMAVLLAKTSSVEAVSAVSTSSRRPNVVPPATAASSEMNLSGSGLVGPSRPWA